MSCDGLMVADIVGGGDMDEYELPLGKRGIGGASGWLKLTLAACAAVVVYAGGGWYPVISIAFVRKLSLAISTPVLQWSKGQST